MKDVFGTELHTGQIVEIKNAYFKNDNGLYFVESSPEDPNWCGNEYSLKRICKNGKISKSKSSICFWPIGVFVNNPETKALANDWNKYHAIIEVKDGINTDYVRDYFIEKSECANSKLRYYELNFGEDSNVTKQCIASRDFYLEIANSL